MTHERPQGLQRPRTSEAPGLRRTSEAPGTSEAGCLVEATRYEYYDYSAAGGADHHVKLTTGYLYEGGQARISDTTVGFHLAFLDTPYRASPGSGLTGTITLASPPLPPGHGRPRRRAVEQRRLRLRPGG